MGAEVQCLPPLWGGQDRALGLGASWYLEDACALVPVVLGTGPKPHGPLFGEAYGASGHCSLLSGKSGVLGELGKAQGSVCRLSEALAWLLSLSLPPELPWLVCLVLMG